MPRNTARSSSVTSTSIAAASIPTFTQNVSVGADLYKQEKRSLRLQADVQNLSNTLEVIDFGGLFSGNALGPSRQYTFRLVTAF